MRHINLLALSIMLFTSLPTMAQKSKNLPEPTTVENSIEDSDLTVKSDYYSGKFQVRSGDVLYNVDLFSGAPYGGDHIKLSNINNEIINKNIPAYDRRTGKRLMTEYLVPMKIDQAAMGSIMQEVFPSCKFGEEGDLFIRLWLIIDPDTLKIKEVSIRLNHPADDKSLYAIPPYKIRLMEKLIKERIIAVFSIPFENLHPARQNASYHIAEYYIHFSDFDLGISSSPVSVQ